ncbi:hypothetical protein [Nocardia sp. NPDC051570]|uniref:hypothetical protein n=1 Tax=Nocardia sp. NPDC051570 TaxID=3364324 RepID=UPI0037874D33
MLDDPDQAQARVFLRVLTARAHALAREMTFGHNHTPGARRRLEAELSTVCGYIDRLHRRFPDTAADRTT